MMSTKKSEELVTDLRHEALATVVFHFSEEKTPRPVELRSEAWKFLKALTSIGVHEVQNPVNLGNWT